MSFNFNWEHAFSNDFHQSATHVLENALNKGNTPALIVGKIEVRELHMGTIVRSSFFPFLCAHPLTLLS